jgi:hydrogenase maturation protein HypF
MAEHGLTESMLGIAWDGVGLGEDNTLWGGEFLQADLYRYKRLARFLPFPLIGGDQAARDPRRAAIGLLWILYDQNVDAVVDYCDALEIDTQQRNIYIKMLQNNINLFYTSSVGRLFDATSCLLNISKRNSFEGEAAIALQNAAESSDSQHQKIAAIELPIMQNNDLQSIDWRPLISQLLIDLNSGASAGCLAKKFHYSLAQCVVDYAKKQRVKTIALSGGCFQNRLLLELTVKKLQQENITAYWPQLVPANDGGIALGQLAIGLNSVHRRND